MGIPPSLSYDEAKERVDQINRHNTLKAQEEKRAKILAKLEKSSVTTALFLPADLVNEFEKRLALSNQQSEVLDKKSKLYKVWKTSLKLMAESQTEPDEWFDKPFNIYNLFLKYKFSADYATRILSIINGYGYFYCRAFKKPFLPIPKMNRKLSDKLQVVASGKIDGNRKSLPLRPEQLESQMSNLKPSQYLWLKYTVWFGLRPEETDKLNDSSGKYWRIETDDSTGVQVLCVNQTKLIRMREEDRWKRIPAFLPEQISLISELINGTKVDRPLNKTMRSRFGERVTCRAGRKGFVKLMKKMGQEPFDISRWLGHSSINRTLKDYTEKSLVSFKKIA
jgi:integrase